MASLRLRTRHDRDGAPQRCAGAGAPIAGAGSAAWQAASRAPGARPQEGIGLACASGAPPQLLQASHDRERAFFVDGDTEELAVLVDGPATTVGIPRDAQ